MMTNCGFSFERSAGRQFEAKQETVLFIDLSSIAAAAASHSAKSLAKGKVITLNYQLIRPGKKPKKETIEITFLWDQLNKSIKASNQQCMMMNLPSQVRACVERSIAQVDGGKQMILIKRPSDRIFPIN